MSIGLPATFASGSNTSSSLEKGKSVMSDASHQAFVGTWQGSLNIGSGMTMPLVLHFAQAESAKLSGSLESPSQGEHTLTPFDEVSVDAAGKVIAKIAKIKGTYDGKISADHKQIVGTWTQNANIFPLTLNRTDKYRPPNRPQEPKEPYPYKVEDVSFVSDGDIALSGTLTMPEGKAKYPAVILIHGSGPHDRDETIVAHKPFKVLADYLTRRGIAVLRYDKRGCGKSSGREKLLKSTSDDFADDVLSAIAFLKHHEGIDPNCIGLIGHSEGGIIAPIVASRGADVKFIVSLAGSALPGDQILLYQVAEITMNGQSKDSEKYAEDVERLKKTYQILKEEPDDNIAIAKIKELRKNQTAMMAENKKRFGDDTKAQDAAEESGLKILTSKWYRHFVSYDPRIAWAKVKCPVLALNGDKDSQVNADDNLKAIQETLKAGGNSNVKVEKLPKLNHLFQTCKSGLPEEYASIEETFSPEALNIIGDWIIQKAVN